MYGERFGVAVPVERVVVTTGASAALVPVVPEVAFYVYADSTRFGADSTDVALRLLERASVACTPGADCGGAEGHRHLRFSYTAPATTIADALDRIEAELR